MEQVPATPPCSLHEPSRLALSSEEIRRPPQSIRPLARWDGEKRPVVDISSCSGSRSIQYAAATSHIAGADFVIYATLALAAAVVLT